MKISSTNFFLILIPLLTFSICCVSCKHFFTDPPPPYSEELKKDIEAYAKNVAQQYNFFLSLFAMIFVITQYSIPWDSLVGTE